MKESKSVIKNLKNFPQFGKIKLFECFNKLKAILPFKLQNGVKFIYIKNSTLFFVLTHNVYLMEFKYNLKVISKLVKELQKIYSECDDIKDIKFFVTNRKSKAEETKPKESNPKYREISKGSFKNLAKDEEVKKIFEEIRDIISSKF